MASLPDSYTDLASVPLARGSRIGPYEILSPLGSGGMGEVYRAKDANLKRDVDLKSGDPQYARPHAAGLVIAGSCSR